MDREILIEYSDTKQEAKVLRQRISELEKELNKLDDMVVMDSVACGKKGKKPLRTVKIQGKPDLYIERKKSILERKRRRLEQMEMNLLEQQEQAEAYIDSIKKSELRIMFRLYYIEGLSWIQVAHKMNATFPNRKKKYTEDSCRMKNNRFFEKN